VDKIESAGAVPAGEGHPPVQDRQDNALVTIDGVGQFRAWVDDRERWNGWLVPRFTRAVAEEVMAWLNAEHADVGDGSDRAEWDGEVWVHHSPMYEDSGYAPERLQPGLRDGRYPIGGYSWTWCRVTPDQLCVPVAQPEGDQPQYAANFAAWLSAAARAGIDPPFSTHGYLSELERLDGLRDGREESVAGLVSYEDGTAYLIEEHEGQVRAGFVGRSKA
jgi:hypothetical protein